MAEVINISDDQWSLLLGDISRDPFHTKDFADAVGMRYPALWHRVTSKFGDGLAGSGQRFSPYRWAANKLLQRVRSGEVFMLGYDFGPPPEDWGSPVIRYWTVDPVNMEQNVFPEEDDPGNEGGVKQVTVNKYERDPKARAACIRHHGMNCKVCDVDFGIRYGEHGAGFIHVHHLVPVHLRAGKAYKVDAKTDLLPVCPNCHAMLHRGKKLLSVDELRSILKNAEG